MKQQIYFDMDGTIVNYHDRFYKIYSESFIEIGEIPLSKKEWIIMRRDGIHHYPPGIHEKIDPYFAQHFESSQNLKHDTIVDGMLNVIHTLQKTYPLKIVSFRSNNINLIKQLNGLGIYNVETIIQGFAPGTIVEEKANMIKNVISNPKGWIVGDTQYEIISGQKLGLKTIAVTYGDRTKEFLEKYNPDFIIDKPEEILDIIK